VAVVSTDGEIGNENSAKIESILARNTRYKIQRVETFLYGVLDDAGTISPVQTLVGPDFMVRFICWHSFPGAKGEGEDIPTLW